MERAEAEADFEQEPEPQPRNSSVPPSLDPPAAPERRRAAPWGRERGARPGHPGRGRRLAPIESLDELIDHWPRRFRCGHVFCTTEREALGLSLGSQSARGERSIERLLSASVTWRLQGCALFAYLSDVLAARIRGDPIPCSPDSAGDLNAYRKPAPCSTIANA
jgi:Family of unknown function (DUF6444)